MRDRPKTESNAGKQWTPAQEQQLKREAAGNTPTRVIGLHLGRPEGGVRAKAAELGVSLKPTNQAPYGTAGRNRRSR
jgi:hypothetical protein